MMTTALMRQQIWHAISRVNKVTLRLASVQRTSAATPKTLSVALN
jgi:hypothetical protein